MLILMFLSALLLIALIIVFPFSRKQCLLFMACLPGFQHPMRYLVMVMSHRFWSLRSRDDDDDDVEIIEPASRVPDDVANLEVLTPPELIGEAIPQTPRELLVSPSFPKGADLPRDSPKPFVPQQPGASPVASRKVKGGIPVDHLFCHQPASSTCDVCRQSKLRIKPHKKFRNQAEHVKEGRIIEAPTRFLERVCIDHLESTEEGLKHEPYALVCVDQFSGCIMAYPTASKSQASVELALRHFCRTEAPVIVSDRYPSLLAAMRDLKMV